MAAVYLKILSTRRTAVGMLYMDTVRKLDSKDMKHAAVIKNLLDTNAAKKLTKKEADEEIAGVESVEKDDGQSDATTQLMKAKSETDEKLATASKTVADLTQGLKEAGGQIDALKVALDKEKAETDKLRQDLSTVTARAEQAEASLKAAQKG